ncbi:hypothetical protein AB6T38_18935 [Aliiglaciecola sp. SL4]|uniref:hypothetical protein n=1 Tax=Aliiglaciecola sp. SL4 TaxID=3239806 RepID=UPI00355B0687
MRITLEPGKWYAAEILSEEFSDSIRSYTPIKIRNLTSHGGGKRIFTLEFYHANYPSGVREKIYELRTLERNRNFILAVSTENKPKRTFLIHSISIEWLNRHFQANVERGQTAEDWLEINA